MKVGSSDSQVSRYLQLVASSMHKLPRYMIPTPQGLPYLERFVLHRELDSNGKTLSGTYLHVIYESDGDRDPHDHPFDFTSTIVHGSYREQAYLRHCAKCNRSYADDGGFCAVCGNKVGFIENGDAVVFQAGYLNEKEAHDLHRLTLVEGPVVTLVRRGPKVREWGFQTDYGWVHHKDYIEAKCPGARPTELE